MQIIDIYITYICLLFSDVFFLLFLNKAFQCVITVFMASFQLLMEALSAMNHAFSNPCIMFHTF